MPFLIIGLVFLVISLATDQNALLPVGIVFIAIGMSKKYQQKKELNQVEDEVSE